MTSTPIYRAILLEVERRRQAAGISMDEMSELMGTAERAYSKMLHCDTPSGRIARWETLQKAVDVLFVDGFDVKIDRGNGTMLTTMGTKRKILQSAASYDRRTRRELMRELSRAAAVARKKIPAKKREAIARKAAKARWRKRRRETRVPARLQLEAARRASAEMPT